MKLGWSAMHFTLISDTHGLSRRLPLVFWLVGWSVDWLVGRTVAWYVGSVDARERRGSVRRVGVLVVAVAGRLAISRMRPTLCGGSSLGCVACYLLGCLGQSPLRMDLVRSAAGFCSGL